MKLNGKESIRIAVTYEDGEIFQHFGQTRQFKFYDTEDGKVIGSKVVEAGAEHCALGSFLYEKGVSVLICGNLGMGASKSLQAAGILVYGGNQGSADEAVDLLLRKKLVYNQLPNCGGHDHSHGCHRNQNSNIANCISASLFFPVFFPLSFPDNPVTLFFQGSQPVP